MKKICTKCKIEKNENEFHKRTKNRRHSICKECKKNYDKYWYGKNINRRNKLKHNAKERLIRNKNFIRNYKISIGCQICGYNKSYNALEFHHKNDDDKKYNISLMKTLSIKTIENEIKKCMIVCANCHREIHENYNAIVV